MIHQVQWFVYWYYMMVPMILQCYPLMSGMLLSCFFLDVTYGLWIFMDVTICDLCVFGIVAYEFPYFWVIKTHKSTSSTAQGGGGSFKNRKTYRRGWLLWITDGRAKPLMDRKVIDVSSLSRLSTYLLTYRCIYRSIDLSIYLSIYLSFYLSIYLSISLSLSSV